MNRGFLGTAAPLTSDLTLIIEIMMGLALIVGARRGRYRAHARCQSTVSLRAFGPRNFMKLLSCSFSVLSVFSYLAFSSLSFRAC